MPNSDCFLEGVGLSNNVQRKSVLSSKTPLLKILYEK